MSEKMPGQMLDFWLPDCGREEGSRCVVAFDGPEQGPAAMRAEDFVEVVEGSGGRRISGRPGVGV